MNLQSIGLNALGGWPCFDCVVRSAGGSKHSVDLFSHLSNDTLITSPRENFEIFSGAQMQLLVGVKK
jgi:hypothetical protein